MLKDKLISSESHKMVFHPDKHTLTIRVTFEHLPEGKLKFTNDVDGMATPMEVKAMLVELLESFQNETTRVLNK